ncbi:MAG: 4a-hydroxytetrahydrobiopterin dehydratase [Parcubacteria group bacterium 21-54-25]|nr:MAG: 4a-hydroxytetrahydrobiopterin dehydratase [Parcubacteria group bacterium 21-54-25]HQU07652.1 4a-hydroxytetrahydrobiopterin dehydratase [Candidatus Paceibacterota bacterium]
MTDLNKQQCVPCEVGGAPLTRAEAEKLMRDLSGWTLALDTKSIAKEYSCKDFMSAIALTNQIAALAEKEGHHPDLSVSWGRVGVTLSTHAVQGLSLNDFILAAKIDALG